MSLLLNKYVKFKCFTRKTKLFDLLVKRGISCINLTECTEHVEVTIPKRDEGCLKKVLNESSIKYETVSSKWTNFFKHLQTRIGLILGSTIFLFVLFLYSKIVWNINVIGNESISDEEILSELNAAGFSEGKFLFNIDFDKLHNAVLKNSKKLSWISINMNGNIANVQVKEIESELPIEKSSYSNVVAKSDGQIISIIVINGKKTVSLKEVVRKGQLLISGVLDSQSEGVRYVDSSGIILAEVNKTINIKIPLKQTIFEKSGSYIEEKSLKILNNNIFFSGKCRNLYKEYDTISISNSPEFFDVKNLPIELTTVRYYEMVEKEVEYTKSEAIELAFRQLRSELDILLAEAEIISKDVKTTFDGENVYLNCSLVCIEDICEKVEFKVEN